MTSRTERFVAILFLVKSEKILVGWPLIFLGGRIHRRKEMTIESVNFKLCFVSDELWSVSERMHDV